MKFERALRRIAKGITGAEGRAHVVLSCRLTDWEVGRDLTLLKEGLPIPVQADSERPPPPTPNELLISAVRQERRSKTTSNAESPSEETPLVVLMVPLDHERIRMFAAGKVVPSLDEFLHQIDAANLWQFARRPLDLDWLVGFWQAKGRLGSLAEMLESSLAERVRETNLDRARVDSLDATRALHALERTGAALVLGHKHTIAIPDSDLLRTEEERPLDLTQVLPDWPEQDRLRLLARPVFDPATYGRARLHNDNEGVVRGYLTASWLHRLRGNNLSRAELFDLIFATSYGIALIRPSLQEAAAWLAIRDEDVAREVLERDPALLLTAGDPASLSPTLRAAVLRNVVKRFLSGESPRRVLDLDSVKRFAGTDLAGAIRELWPPAEGHQDARELLLRLIWLGAISQCADLVRPAAYGDYLERHTRIVGARALMATGDEAAKREYAEYIKTNCAELSTTLIWDAVDALFPSVIGVGDLLAILDRIDLSDRGGGPGFAWNAPSFIDRLGTTDELEEMLHGLLQQLGDEPADIGHIPTEREEAYFSALAATACQLLGRCDPAEASADAIDAALRINLAHRHGRSLHETRNVTAELHRTAARRRAAFWRATERRNRHRWLQGREIEQPWELELFGYPLGLRPVDTAWLLSDAPSRTLESERRLAVNTALRLWNQTGETPELLAQIERIALSDTAMQAAYARFMNPPPPSEEYVAHQRSMKELGERHEAEQTARDRSWIDFIAEVRNDPQQLRAVKPPSVEGVDYRLFHLWHLLRDTTDSSTRYALDSVKPVEPILGPELAFELRDALTRYWRLWQPTPKSRKEANARNRISSMDCMGIAGVSLEAANKPSWADERTTTQATLAAEYATLELNGLPAWIADLARAKPEEVRQVLLREVVYELSTSGEQDRLEVLEDISRAERPVLELMAPVLLEELSRRAEIDCKGLSRLLSIVTDGLQNDREMFAALCLDRFGGMQDMRIAGLYLSAAFSVDIAAATGALTRRLKALDSAQQTALVEEVLPDLFGTGFNAARVHGLLFDCTTLEQLVRIAYGALRFEEDRHRAGGEAYSPDRRDNAQHARSAVFNQFAKTPGRATFAALLRLADEPGFPIQSNRLRELAYERAAEDSEVAPWPGSELALFEQTAEAAPSTPKELQRITLRKFEDMQHDLLHDDFAQGATLKALPNEPAVQTWVADRLRSKQGRTYSVERESHVVEEKEPDVRLRAKASDASLAIEIKVAETWNFEELEAALVDQLCGRYLRANSARHGVLLARSGRR